MVTTVALSRVDDHTFKARLSKLAGYWLTEIGLRAAWVVDRKVIASAGFSSPCSSLAAPAHRTARKEASVLASDCAFVALSVPSPFESCHSPFSERVIVTSGSPSVLTSSEWISSGLNLKIARS